MQRKGITVPDLRLPYYLQNVAAHLLVPEPNSRLQTMTPDGNNWPQESTGIVNREQLV